MAKNYLTEEIKTRKKSYSLSFLDSLFALPANFVNRTYQDQLKTSWKKIIRFSATPVVVRAFLFLCYAIGVSYILYPVCLLLKKSGYRFVTIDLTQIGSYLYLDILLREDVLENQTPVHKIMVLDSWVKGANIYLADLYKDRVTFIRNPFLKLVLSPFFVSSVFSRDNSYRFDIVRQTETISARIWNDYSDKIGGNLIEFPKQDIPKAQELLSKYLPKDQKFVALHVRDNGFYGSLTSETRNADIYTYKKAIKYLISEGYAVIRMGNPAMVDVTSLVEECGNMFFDYAHSDIRSEMLDCYFLSNAEFLIGVTSGPENIPMLFGTPSCRVNWCNVTNALGYLPGDLTTFKKIRMKEDNSLVSFHKLTGPPFSGNISVKDIEKRGMLLEDNSEEEIFATVVEFLENGNAEETELQKQAKQSLKPDSYSYGARGNFSNTILKLYNGDFK